jgi:type I restriction enzyme S subunit
MNNVTTTGQLDWSSFIRVPADSETIAVYRLEKDDVLFNNTNSTELVGKAALFESYEEPVVFSNHFTRLRAATEILLPAFLAFWLQAQWQQGVFAKICDRWVGQSAVHPNKLLSLEMPLPPLDVQRGLVAELDKQMAAVAQMRAAAEREFAAVNALPSALLREVFEFSAMPLPVRASARNSRADG